MTDDEIIAQAIGQLSGGQIAHCNPIAEAVTLMLAAGVDVRTVVQFVRAAIPIDAPSERVIADLEEQIEDECRG